MVRKLNLIYDYSSYFKCVHQKIVVYGKHMQQRFTVDQLKFSSTQVDQALKSEDR